MGILKAKELSKLGYTNDKARSLAINILSKHFKHHDKAAITELLIKIKNDPEDYVHDSVLGRIAGALLDKEETTAFKSFTLSEDTGPLKIYGGKEIEPGAKKQMELAMRLPITVQSALMPDAHT